MKKREIISIIVIIIIAFAFNVSKDKTKDSVFDNTLQVHFIDVGQGDSELILLPDEKVMLIDAGENDIGRKVVNYIKSLNIDKIDFLVGTHPHSDHIGGLDDVISNFDIGEIYMPKVSANTKTFEDVLNAVSDNDLTIKSAEKGKIIYKSEDILIEILAPLEINKDNLNNCSAVVKVTYKDKSALFTGDAEVAVEQKLENVKAEILKVGHHGSSTSSSKEFINKVSPKYCVISLGKDNEYGHPNKETVELFEKLGINTYRTDEHGTVVIKTDGEKIVVETEK